MQKIELTLGMVDGRVKKSKLRFSDFTETAPRKAMIISIALVALNQLCGVFAMLNYTATIFKISGSTMTPNASAIVVSVIQIFGSYLSTALVDRAGRKVCLNRIYCKRILFILNIFHFSCCFHCLQSVHHLVFPVYLGIFMLRHLDIMLMPSIGYQSQVSHSSFYSLQWVF